MKEIIIISGKGNFSTDLRCKIRIEHKVADIFVVPVPVMLIAGQTSHLRALSPQRRRHRVHVLPLRHRPLQKPLNQCLQLNRRLRKLQPTIGEHLGGIGQASADEFDARARAEFPEILRDRLAVAAVGLAEGTAMGVVVEEGGGSDAKDDEVDEAADVPIRLLADDFEADEEVRRLVVADGVTGEAADPLGDGLGRGGLEDVNGKAVADGDDVGEGAGDGDVRFAQGGDG